MDCRHACGSHADYTFADIWLYNRPENKLFAFLGRCDFACAGDLPQAENLALCTLSGLHCVHVSICSEIYAHD